MIFVFFIFLLSMLSELSLIEGVPNSNNDPERKRSFSIFNIVQFDNRPCISDSIFADPTGIGPRVSRNGTCLTTSECTTNSGTPSGSCAAGFGICCLVIVQQNAATIMNNYTYIQNPDFPKTYTYSGNSMTYVIAKLSPGICYIRLDFETFNIQGPAKTDESDGGLCSLDVLKINTASGQKIPWICGLNTGQHIYIDVRGEELNLTATLMFSFSGSSALRQWEISTKYIECTNLSRPPEGCLQYWLTPTGKITTFNFAAPNSIHLANQDVSVCIRREKNYCCVMYQVCTDSSSSFTLDIGGVKSSPTGPLIGEVNEDCFSDYVGISGSTGTVGSRNFYSKFCSPYLNPTRNGFGKNVPVYDCTPPFFVYFHTDNTKDPGANDPLFARSRGVCLNFSQLLCR